MHALLLRCRSGVQFHLGAGSLEETSELLHADTLFSALAHVYALAYDAAGEWVELVRAGRIRFSSGLHCAERSWRPGEPIFFVPRPALRYAGTGRDPSYAKRLKRVRYVSLGVLAEIRAHLCAGAADELPACELDLLDFPQIGGRYACTPDEIAPYGARDVQDDDLSSTVLVPRVEVRSPTGEDAYYHASGITFIPIGLPDEENLRGHFYVLVEHALEPDEWRRFLACVRLLGDEGVGGERTAGYGWFEDVKEAQVAIPATDAGAGITMSLAPVIPAGDDEFSRALHYELFLRGGGSIGLHGEPRLHRKRVRVMREGALFRGTPRGSLVDVSPDDNPNPHPLLRNGLAFALGLEAAP